MDSIMENFVPSEWTCRRLSDGFKLVELHGYERNRIYAMAKHPLMGTVNKIVRVENPYLYGQFLLRKEEYESRGCFVVKQLFHDTPQTNAESIAKNNFDRRLSYRVKFGRGVSFSPDPKYANDKANRFGHERAMIVAKVLVGREHSTYSSVALPQNGFDTTTGNCGKVYVKYYDDEFYPEFIVYYDKLDDKDRFLKRIMKHRYV